MGAPRYLSYADLCGVSKLGPAKFVRLTEQNTEEISGKNETVETDEVLISQVKKLFFPAMRFFLKSITRRTVH